MLSLAPPFLTTGDVMIFRDDVDSEAFYYVCQRPSIAKDADGNPVISMYCILPESGVRDDNDIVEAGLNLDVDLSITDKEFEEVKKLIKKSYGVNPKRLSPAPLHDGKVQFAMALSNGDKDPNWFVTSGMSPSMTGSNRVSLVVRANGKDAETMMAAAVDGIVPACIYYSLNLIGIAPVYHARMEAKMETIYHRFQQTSGVQWTLLSSEVDRVFSDLQEDKSLTVCIEETDPDIHSEALASLMNELKSKVIDTLFQPVTLEKNSAGRSPGLISSLLGGAYAMKKSIDQRVLGDFVVDLSQKNAKLYGFYPQSQLDSMIQAAGIDMKSLVKWIRLDDLPYFEQKVDLQIAGEAFEAASVEKVQLECRVVDTDTNEIVYEQTQPPIPLFDRENPSSCFYFRRERKRNLVFEYRSTMYLKGGSSLLPGQVESDWCRTENPYIYVNPGALLNKFKLELILDDVAVFKKTTQIMAMVEIVTYPDNAVVLTAEPMFFKDGDVDSKTVTVLARKDDELRYNISLYYYLPGKNLEFKYNGLELPVFAIPNPFEKQWSVDLKSHCNWEEISRMYLYTRYLDVEQDRWIENEFTFSEEMPSCTMMAQCGPNTPSRVFEYSVYIDYVDGNRPPAEAGWYRHKGSPSLHLYGDRIVSERVVRIRLNNPEALSNPSVKSASLVFVKDGAKVDEVSLTGAELEYACRPNMDGYACYIAVKKKDNRPLETKTMYPLESDELEIEFPQRL